MSVYPSVKLENVFISQSVMVNLYEREIVDDTKREAIVTFAKG